MISLIEGTSRRSSRALDIRYWLSEKASAYDIEDQINKYLKTSLTPVFEAVSVTFGGVVPIQTEHGYDVMKSGEWPRWVLPGYFHANDLRPAKDVNLLVTDGDMSTTPSGVAVSRLASVGGARHLEHIPQHDPIDDPVSYNIPSLAMQVILHEVGHTLGLNHTHGTITPVDEGAVASPMVSSYAWKEGVEMFDGDGNHCNHEIRLPEGKERFLSFEFSDCAKQTLKSYRGGRLV